MDICSSLKNIRWKAGFRGSSVCFMIIRAANSRRMNEELFLSNIFECITDLQRKNDPELK